MLKTAKQVQFGRALGNAGIGIDTSVASAEEVQNAMLQQEGERIITKVQEEALRDVIKNNDIDTEYVVKLLAKYGYSKLAEIKIKDYMKIVNEIKGE